MAKQDPKELVPLILLEDEPIRSWRLDSLGFGAHANLVASTAIGTGGPFTIGVFARWGQGKTSVLRQAKTLIDDSERKNVVTVWFNAWQYEHEEFPIIPLVATIVREVELHRSKGMSSKLKESFGSLARALRSVAYGFSAKAKVKVPGFGELEASMVAKDMIDREEQLRGREDPLLQQSIYYNAFEVLGQISQRSDEKTKPQDLPKIVVFVDDLDRCFPDQAIRLLEHMKLVLAQPGFVFVLGVDHRILERFLAKRYKEDFNVEDYESASTSYLDKLIQLPIDLPEEAPGFAGHVVKLLGRSKLDVMLGASDEFYVSFVELLVAAADRNPRQLVRLLNNLIIDARLAELRGTINEPEMPAARFLQFDAVSRAVRLQLGSTLYRQLSNDDSLCGQLAEDFEETCSEFRIMSDQSGTRSPERERQRRLVAALDLSQHLHDLLSGTDEGKEWLAHGETRHRVNDFLRTESRGEEEGDKPRSPQKVFEDAVRDSLGMGPHDPLSESVLAAVRELDFSGKDDCDDRVLQRVGNLVQLEGLSLNETQVTDAGLAHLASLVRLERIYLNVAQVTDAGLAHLSKLAQLEMLLLANTQITGAGIVHLAKLTKLRALSLNGTQVTEVGIVQLAKLTQLRELWLNGTQVPDAGLAHLSKLAQLETLQLSGTRVTDAGLAHLAELAQLQMLSLHGTQVTDAGVALLEQALPNCTVVS